MNFTPVISQPTATVNPASVVNPLCIILVKNGSKGDRLLFRYPYTKKPRRRKSFSTNSNTSKKVGLNIGGTNSKNTSVSFTPSTPTTGGCRSATEFSTPSGNNTTPSDVSKTGTSSLEKSTDVPNQTGSSDTNCGDGCPEASPTSLSSVTNKSPLFVGTAKSLFDSPLSQLAGTGKSYTSPGTSNLTPDFGMARLRKVSRTTLTAPIISRGDGENPYSVSKNPSDDLFSEPSFTNSTVDGRKFSLDGSEMLRQLSDKDLSNLLAVNSDLAERKFELKLNFVRFVGHPTLMHNPRDVRPINPEFQTSVKIFHIVFCLNAAASHSIVKCFFDLSKRMGIGLRHEEYRCGFLNQEMRKIIATHDEACTAATEHLEEKEEENVEEKVFDDILAKSRLAQLMKRVYDDVCGTGYTFARINNWVQISFCLPQRVHTLPFRTCAALVEPEKIHACLEAIRPYHALLLLVPPESLTARFWLDASSTIPRLLQVYSPLKSLQTLAADADLTLSQVVEIASHLVYWAHAAVIYPLCESNTYFLAPDVPIDSPELEDAFRKQFPQLSLVQVFADFSLAIPLGERLNPMMGGTYVQSQLVELVTWMLEKRLLIQLHTYIYMATYLDIGSGGETQLDQISIDPDISLNLNSRPFNFPEEDDVTISDSFSEIATNDNEIPRVSPSNLQDVEEETSENSSQNVGTDNEPNSSQDDKAKQNNNNDEVIEPLDKYKSTMPELNNETVKRAVGMVNKASISLQDIKMFSKLAKYFTGEYHVEEIMYRENVRRSQLMLLLDKFRECLITVEKEDAEISFFRNDL